jgi:ribosomal protein S27AE
LEETGLMEINDQGVEVRRCPNCGEVVMVGCDLKHPVPELIPIGDGFKHRKCPKKGPK